MMNLARVLICIALLVSPRCDAVAQSNDDLFENRIRPVLIETCIRCHGEQRAEAELRLDSRQAILQGGYSGPAIDLKEVEQSLLLRAIQRFDEVVAMPPESEKSLRADQIQDFREWLRQGAVWPEAQSQLVANALWSLEPVQPCEPPSNAKGLDGASPRHPIDQFLVAKQSLANVHSIGPADKRTLIRRATFDLTGLPPSEEEIERFERDTNDNAFDRVIERLLASKAYGEKWGRHWLDVARYADTAGETADYPVPTAWKYRDYVVQAFQHDKPYDQFLREQVAGDILAARGDKPSGFAEQTIATGFLAISRRFGFDSENYHHLTIQDTIDTVGQAILGLSLGCARCHDHKFDPVSMSDYYGLYGIFESSRYPFPGSEQKQRLRALVPLVPPAESHRAFRDFEARVAALGSHLEALKKPVPQASLKSLHDMDGDFELQAPAAGGSNGVLVPPWRCRGPVAITNDAQSPFQNVFPRGKVGIHIPAGKSAYEVTQARTIIPDSRHTYFNLDFQLEANPEESGHHLIQFESETYSNPLAIKLTIDRQRLTLNVRTHALATSPVTSPDNPIATTSESLSTREDIAIELEPQTWYSLQLHLDTDRGLLTSTLSTPTSTRSLPDCRVATVDQSSPVAWRVHLSSDGVASHPALRLDNLQLQELALAPASTLLLVSGLDDEASKWSALQAEQQSLLESDPGFELQVEGAAPSQPWHAGPNSVVKIERSAASPFVDVEPKGSLGLRMPNRAEYDGFGMNLAQVGPGENATRLCTHFEFCCVDQANGGEGTWRYYVGHLPGPKPAVELYFNGTQFYCRDGEHPKAVCALEVGRWYQVRLTLDLRARTYLGELRGENFHQSFEGAFPSQWDGIVDYTFIDSYGNLPGVRPALLVDNYLLSQESIGFHPETNAAELRRTTEEKRERIRALRNAMQEGVARADSLTLELQQLLSHGPVPMAYAMAEGTPHAARIHLRGEPEQLGEEVPRGFLTALGPVSSDIPLEGSGRLALANWLTHADNPLTARVMVNRIWLYHFGEGLVKTPNDFGRRGLPPTHPELLDYLAHYFVTHGWSIKQMHRLIMSSQTYQQASFGPNLESSNTAKTASPPDDLYTQFPRRRLTAEEIRDAILVVSDSLEESTAGEHPFPPPTTWGFSQHAPFFGRYDHHQRSLYLMTQRIKRHPFLSLFDSADPNASTPKRLSTTVPTQSLYFLNDPFIHDHANRIATSILQVSDHDQARMEATYRRILRRPPTLEESSQTRSFVASYDEALKEVEPQIGERNRLTWSAVVRMLLSSNEFLYVD